MKPTSSIRIAAYASATAAFTLLLTGIGVAAAADQSVSTISVIDSDGGSPLGIFVGQITVANGTSLGASGWTQVGTWRFRCRYLGGEGRGRQNSHFCTFVHVFPNAGSITASGKVGYSSRATRWLAITRTTGIFKDASGKVRLTNFGACSTPLTFYLTR